MKRKTWIYAGAGAVALAALLAWAFAPRPLEVEAAAVVAGPFETSIGEDGMTRLRDSYRLYAPLTGTLRRIALREGDPVARDAVVAVMAPALAPMQDARTLREQRERIGMADAQLRRAGARIDAARVALQRSQDELARSEQLAGRGYIAASKLSGDRLALQSGQKELEMAQAEQHVAAHEAAMARAAMAAVGANADSRGDFPLRSPIAGRVLRLPLTSETFVTPGTLLMELGDKGQLEVVADVLTVDAAQARPGSPVRIERWGGPVLQGRVRLIEPAAFTKISVLGVEEQRVKVVIDIDSAPAQWSRLGIGYRVGVRIVTLASDKVLTVPVSAVFPLPPAQFKDGRTMGVYVIDKGRARLRAVQLGGRNDSQAWIRDGVAEGARVIVYPAAEIGDGVRVHERSAAPA
jgi:HlyD family secretion protein